MNKEKINNANVDPLVSIIVPVYNAQEYLLKCIESILNQTYNNIECILIDDGSTDSSLSICRDIQNKDSRVSIYNQANSGVSSARNTGISKATGEWIMFVDSDDWIEPNAVEEAISTATTNRADLVAFNFYKADETSKQNQEAISSSVLEFSGQDTKYAIMSLMAPHYNYKKKELYIPINSSRSSCGKIFNISIYKHIRFKEGLPIAEDALFCMQAFQLSKKTVFINKYLYNYRTNLNSAIHTFRPDIHSININIYNSFKSHIPSSFSDFEQKVFMLGIIRECAFNLLYFNHLNSKNKASYITKLKMIKLDLKNEIFTDIYSVKNNALTMFPIHQRILIYLCTRKHVISLSMYHHTIQNLKRVSKKG